jgi:hypothetical protein
MNVRMRSFNGCSYSGRRVLEESIDVVLAEATMFVFCATVSLQATNKIRD